MPITVQAALWGLLAGSALLLGAGLAWFLRIPPRLVAAVMAFGSGVLVAALSFELMEEAYRHGGFDSTSLGFLVGGAAFTAADIAVSQRGGGHRKRSGGQQQKAADGSGLGIAVGALLDGIPEAVVIGVSLLRDDGVSLLAVAAVFLSNVPEGLSSAAGMRRAGRGAAFVFGVWGGIALASGAAALAGNLALSGADPEMIATANAVAAGAILAMVADTMIPEAFEETREFTGLITVAGFLAAFVLSKLDG